MITKVTAILLMILFTTAVIADPNKPHDTYQTLEPSIKIEEPTSKSDGSKIPYPTNLKPSSLECFTASESKAISNRLKDGVICKAQLLEANKLIDQKNLQYQAKWYQKPGTIGTGVLLSFISGATIMLVMKNK